MTTRSAPAGRQLRTWRQRRRLSQMDLAVQAGTSTRHLSYLENGRAQPSREMVLRLAETMDVPLRDRNAILLGAGFAPVYPDATADRAARTQLLGMLDDVLGAYEPCPALVLDADFDVVAANATLERLLAVVDPALLAPPINVVRVTLHPRGLAPLIRNLPAWRAHLLRQVRQHAAVSGRIQLDELLAEVLGYPVGSRPPAVEPDGGTFALPLELRIGGSDLRFYSTIATFGTPLDVAASELAIEAFLPADPATRNWLGLRADARVG